MKHKLLNRVSPIILVFLLVSSFEKSLALRATGEGVVLRTHALKINVDDLDKALAFYRARFGFDVEDESDYPRQVTLRSSDRVKLILNKVHALRKLTQNDTGISFTLQVNDLNRAMEKMKAAGVEFEGEPRREGVGNAVTILDPFGRRIHLMHHTLSKVEPFNEPKIYNFGYYIPDMAAARDFYARKLGFVEYTERFLPLDMPLRHTDKTFGFMLHYREGVRPIKSEYPKAAPFYTVVFQTDNFAQLLKEMRLGKIKIVSESDYSVVIEDPFGNISEVIHSSKT